MAQRIEGSGHAGSRQIVLQPAGTAQHDRPSLAISRVPSRYESYAKPVIDRLVGLILLVALLPVMVVIAAAVAMQLGSPLLLMQKRIGLHGRPFMMCKFRTMLPDRRREEDRRTAPRAGAQERRMTHKTASDPRHTPLGRFLRKWSLDELPQLLNVVKGDMSLVGPRPELAQVVERYEPWQHARHVVRPGITGPWQVSIRGRGGLMHEHTELDLEYAREVSLAKDLKMLALTIPALLGLTPGE